MALPETSENMVTVRRLSSVVSGVWEKAKEHFATAAQGAAADSAIQGVKVNGTELSKDGNKVDVPVPTAFTDTPLKDGTASAGSSSQWARGDHVHPTDDSREAVSNKVQSIDDSSTMEYPSSKAVAEFVNSSVATNTATFLGNFSLADLGLTYPATEVQIAAALNSHTWPTDYPTNNDYVYVEIRNPQSTIDDKVQRYKYRDGLASWDYEYTLNNSSFTAEEKATIDSGVTSQDVTNLRADHTTLDTHIANTNNPHSVTKSQVGLGSVVNTGDSATPVSGGTTKFTTGGAYTELAKKVDKETGKGLSANDFTNTYKTKLDGIASGAEVNVQSNWNQSDNTKDDYIKNKPNLATVATSGSYNDLSNKPTIPAAQVNSDWNATSGVAQIKNKPSLATVATSGSYNDLSNKPSIPAAANNGVLTITQNGTSKGTFSANQSSNGTIALTDTTYSQISRGSGAGLAPGLPSGSGTSKYLREDGVWYTPPHDTYSAGDGLTLSEMNQFDVINPFNPNGDYSSNTLRANTALSADYAAAAGSATNDGNGRSIVGTYAAQTGTYPDLVAGLALNAQSAISADEKDIILIQFTDSASAAIKGTVTVGRCTSIYFGAVLFTQGNTHSSPTLRIKTATDSAGRDYSYEGPAGLMADIPANHLVLLEFSQTATTYRVVGQMPISRDIIASYTNISANYTLPNNTKGTPYFAVIFNSSSGSKTVTYKTPGNNAATTTITALSVGLFVAVGSVGDWIRIGG